MPQVQEVEARVSGKIPDWVEGTLIANGGAEYTGVVGTFRRRLQPAHWTQNEIMKR